MDDVMSEIRNVAVQIKRISNISKVEQNSLEYKSYLYAEEARVRSNLQRLVPTIILMLLSATYLLVFELCSTGLKKTQLWVAVGLFCASVVISIVYTILVARLLNKSKVIIKAGKWIYLSFWNLILAAVFGLSIYSVIEDGNMESWFAFLAIALVAPVLNREETAEMLILAEILAMITAYLMNVQVWKFVLISIPFIIIAAFILQSTYISRMKVLLTQSKIEQRGYMVQRRMESIFDDLFDEVYEINLNNKTFTLIHSKETFQPSYMRDNYQKSINYIADTLVHPDDSEQYKEIFSIDNIKAEYRDDNKQIYHEARRLKSTGEYAWVSTLMIREYTENPDEFRLIQLIQDIDSRKTSEVKLMTEAQTDPLTRLYNKMTTKELIEEYIAGEGADGSHAFIIIDMDEFKSINDTHGHFVGDDVLHELAKELKGYFRESDIIGRIGGDEFVAFIKNIQSVALVCDKVQRLSASLKKYGIEHDYSHKLSTSMGIAIYNKDGKTYDELYKSADKALYEAKRNGKDQYKFCIQNYE